MYRPNVRNSDILITSLTTVIMLMLAVPITLSAAWNPLTPGTPLTAPQVRVLEESQGHLLLQVDIFGYFNDVKDVGGNKYDELSIDENRLFDTDGVGQPQLPFINVNVHLPEGTVGLSSVMDVDWLTAGTFRLYPAQQLKRDDGNPAPEFTLDERAYSSDEWTPKHISEISRPMGLKGLLVSSVVVKPIRYQPSTGTVEIASSITVRVDFMPGDPIRPIQPAHYTKADIDLFNNVLINPPRQLGLDDADEVETQALVVLLGEAYETAKPLIDFHHAAGLKTEVWIADNIRDDNDNGSQAIKDVVLELYEEEGLEYLFIIGDGYRNDFDIPMYYWDPYDPGYQDRNPTDSYSDAWYVCLDPADEDDEGHEIEDHLPELSVGRLVYDDLEELAIQINKTLNYLMWSFEENADGDWLNNAVLVGHKERDSDFRPAAPYHYIDDKRFIMNYDYDLPHPEFNILVGTDNEDDFDDAVGRNQDIWDAMNDGIGFYNYRGHGSNTANVGWNEANETIRANVVLNNLENQSMPFIYTASACWNGNIATYNGDCLNETFIKMNGGAVAVHGSIISTYTEGNSYSDRMLYRSFFDDGYYAIGQTQHHVTTRMVLNWAQSYYTVLGRMNTRAYAWLGDPMLEYRLDPPEQLVVDIPAAIEAGADFLEIEVTRDGAAVESVTVCIRDEDDAIYVVAETDFDGIAQFDFGDGLEENILHWMATERNSIPASGRLFVADGVGAIEGTVTSSVDDQPVEAAEIYLSYIEDVTYTDSEGFYSFDIVPVGDNYTVIARPVGYVEDSELADVLEGETTIVNFSLDHARFDLDVESVHLRVDVDSSEVSEVNFSNGGNGTLDWAIGIEYIVPEEGIREVISLNASEITDDNRLYGVEYVDGALYVTGGNDNGDPNYIYEIFVNEDLMSGELNNTFDQPARADLYGIRDIAYDGEYFYGGYTAAAMGEANTLRFSLDGEVADTIIGIYDPPHGIAYDSEYDVLYTSDGTEAIMVYNWAGHPLHFGQLRNPGLDIQGMAMGPDSTLFLFVASEETSEPQIYQYDIFNEQAELIADFTGSGYTPRTGFCYAESYEEGTSLMIGMIEDDGEMYIKGWMLNETNNWLSVDPTSGSLEPGNEGLITLTASPNSFQRGTRQEAELIITNNGIEPRIILPVVMDVPVSVREDDALFPTVFTVGSPYPNPFNSTTAVEFQIPVTGRVEAVLFDLNGRIVERVVNREFSAGVHSFQIGDAKLPSGVYLLKVNSGSMTTTKKIVLIR